MAETIVSPRTPSQDEYGIVATFSESSLDALSIIQDSLTEHLGDSIWLTPRRALHCTLMEIICDRDYGNVPRKQIFDDWYKNYNQTVLETLAEIPLFDISFIKLEVSQRAIIARLTNSQVFNDIRAEILSRIRLPEGTKLPPDITHVSLARFNKSVDLVKVIDKTKDIKVNFSENLSNFQLLKDLGSPRFEPRLIQNYPLAE